MADTKVSLYEIELMIAKSRDFDFTKKLVVFNVYGTGGVLPLWHECDVLVCTKLGYLTEIEIKRSYADFLNDFKKDHMHASQYIKNFYYCVPDKIKDKVIEHLQTLDDKDWRKGAGIIVYYEDNDWIDIKLLPYENKKCIKLTTEQMLYLARLGSMRVMTLKRKVLRMEKQLKDSIDTIKELEKRLEEKYDKLDVVDEQKTE